MSFFLRSKQPEFDLPLFPKFFVWILLTIAELFDQRRNPEFFNFSRLNFDSVEFCIFDCLVFGANSARHFAGLLLATGFSSSSLEELVIAWSLCFRSFPVASMILVKLGVCWGLCESLKKSNFYETENLILTRENSYQIKLEITKI